MVHESRKALTRRQRRTGLYAGMLPLSRKDFPAHIYGIYQHDAMLDVNCVCSGKSSGLYSNDCPYQRCRASGIGTLWTTITLRRGSLSGTISDISKVPPGLMS